MHANSQRAVSPVIGSIVLVALTAVLATVVADLEDSEVRVVWSEHGLEETLAETSL